MRANCGNCGRKLHITLVSSEGVKEKNKIFKIEPCECCEVKNKVADKGVVKFLPFFTGQQGNKK